MFKWFCDNQNLVTVHCGTFSIQFCTQRWHQLFIYYAPPTASMRELIISAWCLTHHVFLTASRTSSIHVCVHVYILIWPSKYFLRHRPATVYRKFLLLGEGRLNAFHSQESEELSGFQNADVEYMIYMHTYRHLHGSMFMSVTVFSVI